MQPRSVKSLIIYAHFCIGSDSEFRYKRESDVSDVESIEIPDILLHDEDWELEPLEVPSDDDGEKFVEYKKFLAMYADYKKTKETKETKGEVGMNDLPPIAELTITVPESDCVEFGKVSNIVDTLGELIALGDLFENLLIE